MTTKRTKVTPSTTDLSEALLAIEMEMKAVGLWSSSTASPEEDPRFWPLEKHLQFFFLPDERACPALGQPSKGTDVGSQARLEFKTNPRAARLTEWLWFYGRL